MVFFGVNFYIMFYAIDELANLSPGACSWKKSVKVVFGLLLLLEDFLGRLKSLHQLVLLVVLPSSSWSIYTL